MKIDGIELSWFRGAAQKAQLKANLKSMVVYGPNGSGKSTFPDALEYLFRNGKIQHLTHEYSGRKQEKGIRNTHAGSNQTEILITFENNKKVNISIHDDGSNVITYQPSDFKEMISCCQANQVILRQDEIANFVNSNKGEKYSSLLPLLGLSDLETVLENISDLKEKILEQGQLPQNIQKRSNLITYITKYFPDPTESKIYEQLILIGRRHLLSIPEDRTELIKRLIDKIDEEIKKVNYEVKKYTILKQIKDENLSGKLAEFIQHQDEVNKYIDSLLSQKLEVLEKSSEFSKHVKDEVIIICPSCGQEVEKTRFISHIESELKKLNQTKEIYQQMKKARRNFTDSIRNVFQIIKDDEIAIWLNLKEQNELNNSLTILNELKIDEDQDSFTKEKIAIIQRYISKIIELIENEIKKTPPSVESLIIDKELVNAIKTIPEIKEITTKLKGTESLVQTLNKIEVSIQDELKTKTQGIISHLSEGIMSMWSFLHPGEPIENIHLNIPSSTDKAIDICLKFHGVDQPSPRLTLSEGHKNSLGLCIFLTIAKTNGLDTPILLDDIITSLDREHRSFVADLLLRDFSDRQILLFTHDREWFIELTHRLPQSNWKFMKLKTWDQPGTGLQWFETYKELDEATSILTTDAASAGNKARGIMDCDLSIIAEKLRLNSLQYLRGDKNDQRGAVEFLECITSEVEKNKRFKKKVTGSTTYNDFTEPISEWKKTISLLIPWANRASHGGYVTHDEVKTLIESCQRTLDFFKCPDCREKVWISNQESRKRLQCSCGHLQWRYE